MHAFRSSKSWVTPTSQKGVARDPRNRALLHRALLCLRARPALPPLMQLARLLLLPLSPSARASARPRTTCVRLFTVRMCTWHCATWPPFDHFFPKLLTAVAVQPAQQQVRQAAICGCMSLGASPCGAVCCKQQPATARASAPATRGLVHRQQHCVPANCMCCTQCCCSLLTMLLLQSQGNCGFACYQGDRSGV